jgi:hypothetical protein
MCVSGQPVRHAPQSSMSKLTRHSARSPDSLPVSPDDERTLLIGQFPPAGWGPSLPSLQGVVSGRAGLFNAILQPRRVERDGRAASPLDLDRSRVWIWALSRSA